MKLQENINWMTVIYDSSIIHGKNVKLGLLEWYLQ